MVFNCLRYEKRFKVENIAIVGIYYGRDKPDMQALLKLAFEPYLAQLNSFVLRFGVKYFFKFKFLIADKPAKSMLLNFQSHNAKYFCPICDKVSSTEIVNNTRHVFVKFDGCCLKMNGLCAVYSTIFHLKVSLFRRL